jgi:hypothetical protein
MLLQEDLKLPGNDQDTRSEKGNAKAGLQSGCTTVLLKSRDETVNQILDKVS